MVRTPKEFLRLAPVLLLMKHPERIVTVVIVVVDAVVAVAVVAVGGVGTGTDAVAQVGSFLGGDIVVVVVVAVVIGVIGEVGEVGEVGEKGLVGEEMVVVEVMEVSCSAPDSGELGFGSLSNSKSGLAAGHVNDLIGRDPPEICDITTQPAS